MNEVGPIAVADRAAGGHVLLQPNLHVEIVDDDGHVLPEGERGEVCVTGGFNFCLPLVRYRTGDTASLARAGGEPVLIGLSGRRPIRFRTVDGGWINNIDISHALKPIAVAQFGVHQSATGAVTLRLSPHAMSDAPAAEALLRSMMGDVPITVEPIGDEGKILQYTSGLPDSTAA
jgi:phenylacetate-CoA ligase